MRIALLTVFLLLGLTVSFGQGSVHVVAEKANIRTSPSAKAAVVATVAQDELLEVIETRGAWYKVKTASHIGWVHGNSVTKVLSSPTLLIPRAYGDPDSRYGNLSSGPGTGTGRGQGQGSGTGTGTGATTRNETVAADPIIPDKNAPPNAALVFLSKPKASYTETARKNQVQGTVRLKVTFLASGQIGAVTAITSLPDGLTDKAVDAARLIRFIPQRVKGIPRTVVKIVEYTFYVY